MIELNQNAATVSDLAEHMDRLREQTIELHNHLETRSRGYFTPTEDDMVLGLWVSYHKSRNRAPGADRFNP